MILLVPGKIILNKNGSIIINLLSPGNSIDLVVHDQGQRKFEIDGFLDLIFHRSF